MSYAVLVGSAPSPAWATSACTCCTCRCASVGGRTRSGAADESRRDPARRERWHRAVRDVGQRHARLRRERAGNGGGGDFPWCSRRSALPRPQQHVVHPRDRHRNCRPSSARRTPSASRRCPIRPAASRRGTWSTCRTSRPTRRSLATSSSSVSAIPIVQMWAAFCDELPTAAGRHGAAAVPRDAAGSRGSHALFTAALTSHETGQTVRPRVGVIRAQQRSASRTNSRRRGGHVCLDLIPSLPRRRRSSPAGCRIGPALSDRRCVANAGLALHDLACRSADGQGRRDAFGGRF